MPRRDGPQKRAALLVEACAGDEGLRLELGRGSQAASAIELRLRHYADT